VIESESLIDRVCEAAALDAAAILTCTYTIIAANWRAIARSDRKRHLSD
jgi:hypothetical protein